MDHYLGALRRDHVASSQALPDGTYLAGVLRGLVFLFVVGVIFLAISFAHSFVQMSWSSYSLPSPHEPLKFAITHRY